MKQSLKNKSCLAFFAMISSCCHAATNTTTFNVTATVAANCSISANTLAFGAYNPLSAPTDSTTDITITCTNGSGYNVGLNAGTTAGGTVTNRLMANGANTLGYGLYQNSGRTINWGDTIGTDTVSGTGNGGAQTLTVYGRIPSAQYVPPGSYSDTITITATF
ncbi:spore coat protein U domain-containing protein [Candidatus Berkiella aquae]|uniref:Spore coat U domain-containing protein n=1 Tax=Candidatus Berkiella aquae TaxID=295108 RepID=A0AAE3HUX7_9GAMM|nr:spore coat U domain-containing protein [Candidatus Berkiella aquae]MCS5710952.1 spore coat U domain-containing protein [Candidatus Berkiella aquae]